MTQPRFAPDERDLEKIVRRLVAQQASMDEFKVKLTDRIDEDIGLAGLDVSELLQKITEQFETDFSRLDVYWDDYFYPEAADFDGQMFWPLLIAVPVALPVFMHNTWPHIFSWCRIGIVMAMLLIGWIVIRWHLKKTHEPYKLQITVGELVETVKAGKWTPPKDIDEQICKRRQKRLIT